jgi:hypothetical protein
MISMQLLYVLLLTETVTLFLGMVLQVRGGKRLDGIELGIAILTFATLLLTILNTPHFFPGN